MRQKQDDAMAASALAATKSSRTWASSAAVGCPSLRKHSTSRASQKVMKTNAQSHLTHGERRESRVTAGQSTYYGNSGKLVLARDLSRIGEYRRGRVSLDLV
jgi:hypothetical protein